MMRIVHRAELVATVDLDTMREAVRRALIAAAHGEVTQPPVMHLDLGARRGDLHIKSAWIRTDPIFAVKVAGAFAGATAAGRPAQQGLSMAFDATTGSPVALFLDDGWLTEVRTAAAGALAVEQLAPRGPIALAVLGSGSQARHQTAAVARVSDARQVTIWGRDHRRAAACASELGDALRLDAVAAETVDEAVAHADVVITTTSATAPVLHADALPDKVLVIAVGADTPGKRELAAEVLAGARLVVDDLAQAREQGELQHVHADTPAEILGMLLEGARRPDRRRTVVDLTGLGAQDAAAASAALQALA